MLEELKLNQAGKMSRRQVLFLARWLLYRFLTITLIGLFVANYLAMTEKLVMTVTVVGITILFTYQYIVDIWKQEPASVFGQITKENLRVRGPIQHYVVFSSGLSVRVPDSIWENLREGGQYKVYYARHTKWLLSYQMLSM